MGTLAVMGVVVFPGCSRHREPAAHEQAHDGHDDATAGAPVSFKEGHGLLIAPATAAAIGLGTAEVEDRAVGGRYTATAAVFDAGPPARAASLVPGEIAALLEKHSPDGIRVLSVRRESPNAPGQVEVVLELPGAPAAGSTLRLALERPEHEAATVPRDAVLRTAAGTFVYVANGPYFLRTGVRPGASDDARVEILEGLYPGDVVAVGAAGQLWLIELRLTKGGGHSH